MYNMLSAFAQTWGLGFFVCMFAVAVAYAFWPANQATFNNAARAPLDDREPSDD